MRLSFTLLAFMLVSLNSFSQSDTLKRKKKGGLYLTWGYTKAVYSKSSIHLKNLSNKYNPVTGRYDYYSFTVHNATAHDRPDLRKVKDIVNVTIPQYVFRIGYQINDKWSVELNYDHTKYVVDDYQTVRVEGQFNDEWIDKTMVLDPDSFLHFEHTDGANFWMINAVRQFKVYKPNKNFKLSWVVKPGAGVVIPRTEVHLFGQRLNNDWKLSGWIVGVESGFRGEFFKHGFFEFVAKGSYANYVNAFVLGAGNGTASHHFFTGQLTGTLGYKF